MDLAPLVYEPMTFVVLDATSPDGEAALGALTDADQHVTLLALLGHRSAGAIHDFAAAEQLSAPEAADVYLDQAAERVSADRDRLVQTVVSAEADMVRTVREFVALENVRRVVVSRSLLADDPTSASEALRRLPVEVEIVGPRPMSSDRSRRWGRHGRRLTGRVTTLPSMQDIPNEELVALDVLTTCVDVDAAEQLIEQDAPGQQCMFVVDGLLAVERDGDRIAELGPGQCAGELALLTGAPCNADVVAATDATLLVMSRHEFTTMLDECPTIATRVLRQAVRRLAA